MHLVPPPSWQKAQFLLSYACRRRKYFDPNSWGGEGKIFWNRGITTIQIFFKKTPTISLPKCLISENFTSWKFLWPPLKGKKLGFWKTCSKKKPPFAVKKIRHMVHFILPFSWLTKCSQDSDNCFLLAIGSGKKYLVGNFCVPSKTCRKWKISGNFQQAFREEISGNFHTGKFPPKLGSEISRNFQEIFQWKFPQEISLQPCGPRFWILKFGCWKESVLEFSSTSVRGTT